MSERDPTDVRRLWVLAAELGLWAVAAGTVVSLTRLFVAGDWLPRLLVVVTVACLVAASTRRAGLGVLASSGVHLVVAALTLSWVLAPSTLALVLPTTATARTLADEIVESFAAFDRIVAPTSATTGFLVVVALALWLLVAFADVAAMRYRAPVQAVVPYLSAFAAIGLLARDSGRISSALAFAAGLCAYAATQRALVASQRRWVGGRRRSGTRAAFGAALGAGVVAVVAGLLLGPLLPGSAEPVLDLREIGRGDGPRTVVSPFVGLRSLLGDRSDQVMFTVTAGSPAYWRLTALEEFDRERDIWISRGSYRRTDGELSEPVPGQVLEQRFDIDGMGGLWLPAASTPVQVDAPVPLSFDPGSDSLILRDSEDPELLDYTVRSVLPDEARVLTAGASPGVSSGDEDLDRPELSAGAREQLGRITAGASTPYEQLLALQNWFRDGFTYDEDVDYSSAPDALDAFLADRRGFCQQFSSAFALLARELGIPSRVAVGFTSGDPVQAGDGASGGDAVEFVVRGRHAHAWPEVQLGDAGWVPFEPTPRRGNPQAQGYTGVPPQQAAAPPEQAATTTAPSTTASTATTPSTAPDGGEIDATGAPGVDEEATTGDRDLPVGTIAIIVAVLVVVGAGAALVLRRSSRHATRGASGAVSDAWRRAVRSCTAAGAVERDSETPLEFAERVGDELDVAELRTLALHETRRRFAAGSPSDADAVAAEQLATSIAERLRSSSGGRAAAAGGPGAGVGYSSS